MIGSSFFEAAIPVAPFLLGLAIAVIIQIVTVIAAIAPTVNGEYARYKASRFAGINVISIHSAPLLLILVILRANHSPPSSITSVITLRLIGAFNGLSVGIALNVKVALGDNSLEEICIDSPKGVLL